MMITQVHLTVRSAVEADRAELASLIQLEPYVHRHLDWRSPIDWLGRQPFLVAERGDRLVAAIACPPDPPGASWIRTFAVSGNISIARAWDLLWGEVIEQLKDHPGVCVAGIPLYQWFRRLLQKSSFVHTHNVVLLAWEGRNPPPPRETSGIRLRRMTAADLPAVMRVDNAAFNPLWRNSLETVTLAFQQSVLATVAEDEVGVVGYQISTPSPHGWHLARLAVHPAKQRRGIAYSLTQDLLAQFTRRGRTMLTVNTQHDNQASLILYNKTGFQRTGEEYPVYQFCLTD